MNREDKERLEREAEEELNRRFGEGVVQKAEVLQYGDEPVIEPGQVMVRVILNPTDEHPKKTLHAFTEAHDGAIKELRAKIAEKMPFIGHVQFTVPSESEEDNRIGIMMQGKIVGLGKMEDLRRQAQLEGRLEDVFFKITEGAVNPYE